MTAFPKHFVWGAAASSYQIEGAAYKDGKGLSVWDAFCHRPGAIRGDQTGDVSCDHYHRFREDVALMKTIGLQAYRFSICWPRVLPKGTGEFNPKGLAFYDQLVDELLQAGIQPYVTLFHWDYPQALYNRGGWLNPSSPDWFAEYASLMARTLGDRVKFWITHNEPQVFIGMGHQDGYLAPGLKLSWRDVLLAGHNALLAHGKAVQALRTYCQGSVKIGMAPVGNVKFPAGNSAVDIDTVRQAMFAVNRQDFWNNSWFSDPVFFKHYPEDGVALYGNDMPVIGPDDFETIGQPLDFYGANIYAGEGVCAGAGNCPEAAVLPVGHAITTNQWFVTPESLYWGPRFLYERYGKPIYIMENGLANMDWVHQDGKVHDPQRIDFLARYLTALHRAIADGVDVLGYFHWSVMDNFEWAEGYRQRFGLIFVDYATQKRILKDSALWYRDVIATNCGNLA
jgi:beta-glucosidase